jgi:hypothetical protein
MTTLKTAFESRVRRSVGYRVWVKCPGAAAQDDASSTLPVEMAMSACVGGDVSLTDNAFAQPASGLKLIIFLKKVAKCLQHRPAAWLLASRSRR